MKAFALNESRAVIASANQAVTFTACGSFFLLSGQHELQAAKEAIEYALNYGEQPTNNSTNNREALSHSGPAYRGGYQPISTSGPVQAPPRKP